MEVLGDIFDVLNNIYSIGPLGWWFAILVLYGFYVLVIRKHPKEDPNTADWWIQWTFMYVFFYFPIAFSIGAIVLALLGMVFEFDPLW